MRTRSGSRSGCPMKHRDRVIATDVAWKVLTEDTDSAPQWQAEKIVTGLCVEFYLIPKAVMQNDPPSLLRERAHFADRDGQPWLAQWLRDVAEATED